MMLESMASFLCCCRCRWDPTGSNSGHVRLEDLPAVKMDTSFMGHDVVIVKSGKRICGTGAALGNAPIVQNKAYFESKLQCSGVWGVGVATRHVGLHSVPLGGDKDSWVLRNDGIIMHNNKEHAKLPEPPTEGDIISVSYDHIELNFYINGKNMNVPYTGIKGTVFPVVYVDEGATLDMQFAHFYHDPPPGFEEIMIEKSLL